MKRCKFLLLLFLSINLYGQSEKEYSLHFDIDDFTFQEECGQIHISSRNNDAFVWGDTLSPALPCIGVNILIAPTEIFDGFSEEYKEVLAMSEAIIEPNPLPLPTNSSQLANGKRYVTYKNAFYPRNEIEYTGTHLMDGYKYLSFVVCPFRYDVLNRQLYLKTDLTIKLKLTQQGDCLKKKDGESRNNIGYNMYNIVKKTVLNGNEVETLYEKTSLQKKDARSSSSPYEYIIVTNETLRPVFENLAHWKTIKGVKTKVITVEDCCDEYPNYTAQLAIKTVLSDYYNNGMAYALLGGDTNVVPAQICYLPHLTVDTTDTPADLYYACLDNCFSWDADGDHIYAETNDNVDLDPEFIITRTSVSNLTEAETFVNRIIEYECSPNLDGWTNNMLSCGNVLYYYPTKNNVQISDAQYQGEYVYENGVQNHWNGTWFELFDTYTDHTNGANYNATGEHFQTEFEKGYTFVDEFSHGWANKWGWLEDETLYKLDKASSLVNNSYTVITTIACYTNSFDKISTDFPNETEFYTTCLSESFIRNPNSGILAYFGSSREGWTSCSYLFDEKFYENLLPSQDRQFGRAAMLAKNAYLGSVSLTGFNNYRWLIMTLNPIGDPEMPIFINTPQYFSNVNVSFSNGNLSVTTGLPDCKICVSSVADYGDSYYELSDSTNSAYFTGVNDDCYLCITKTGYIPYVARVGNSVFLQNETIIKDLPIFSTTTFVGSDETTLKPQGPVTIKKGKVTNLSQGAVTIKNDFEVKLGAELEIEGQ